MRCIRRCECTASNDVVEADKSGFHGMHSEARAVVLFYSHTSFDVANMCMILLYEYFKYWKRSIAIVPRV